MGGGGGANLVFCIVKWEHTGYSCIGPEDTLIYGSALQALRTDTYKMTLKIIEKINML